MLRKRTDFLNIFVPKYAYLPMHYGAQLHREGTKLAKGHIYALMGHLALHIIGPLATTEQGNCPAILALHISVFIGTVEPGKLSQ